MAPVRTTRIKGLALIVVVGVLGVMAVLAVAFVTMAQLERKASLQRVNAERAFLLARSGVEDALARLALGQDPVYGGEDWDGDTNLSAFEAAQEIFHVTGTGTSADIIACPVRQAMRPSFYVQSHPSLNPLTVGVDARQRGYSGALKGNYAAQGNQYALKVEDLNNRIYINGGALDARDRDPDGPGAPPEAAPLLPNGLPDYRDWSMEGPNGFLVRLLNNLDDVVTGGATSNLGVLVLFARPRGGYRSLEDLKAFLSPARYVQVKDFLTTTAWVDPKVVKPQPMDGRPQRFLDIDDAHRTGATATNLGGVRSSGPPPLLLNSDPLGNGTQASPWSQSITSPLGTDTNPGTYRVRWERNFIYTLSQLRPAHPALEPRAPISLNSARPEVLAAAFPGLKGSYLETWDGNAGWDGGFGFYFPSARPDSKYTYPLPETEDSPWYRNRVDYGMGYGLPGRPWYGPSDFDPHTVMVPGGGKTLVQAGPLGRLRETSPISLDQARVIADQVVQRVAQAGPIRTWAQFNAFVDALPLWEDVNSDGVLDGPPYTVNGEQTLSTSSVATAAFTRRMYQREDANSDGVMNNRIFTVSSGSWSAGNIAWVDRGTSALGAGDVRGLTRFQKDALKAMANPNTDLNCFNPDANLYRDVDKAGLAGIPSAAASYAHTTELALDSPGLYQVHAAGRVLDASGRLLAFRQEGATVQSSEIHRDTTQADFMKAWISPPFPPLGDLFSNASPAHPLTADQALVSYPEPQSMGIFRTAIADYDGQIGLGFIAPEPGPDETLRGGLFGTANAAETGDAATTDINSRGPSMNFLLPSAPGSPGGNIFPDGVYSEKDRTLA